MLGVTMTMGSKGTEQLLSTGNQLLSMD